MLGLVKISFLYAILTRCARHFIKQRKPQRVEVNLPEGIKFLLTWGFIYGFTLVFMVLSSFIINLF